ncbi:hypothetical protein LIPSTDRAFT_5540 [Lipomyces starkeyi NRRL Y-11557]|uniref:DUF159-domain-containing protein n=1 Tax=Lipomyces starkeyi NRRL Y-11557 TaxID=675824 RepID=A0A1E3PZK4_LIPST|nr:hypothetical protein LIPSTDRAFT_5540 [Lipomyces starkeyi NRRL Y-11557]
MHLPLNVLRDHMREDGIELDEFMDDGENLYYPTNNVRPTTYRPVFYHTGDSGNEHLEGRVMRWGFVPSWSSEISKRDPPVINARTDNLGGKMWSKVFRHGGRCVVPADGYYEWLNLAKAKDGSSMASTSDRKAPYFVRPKDSSHLMYFAGLYSVTYLKSSTQRLSSDDPQANPEEEESSEISSAKKNKKVLFSFTIVTTDASESMKFLHDRMPLILFAGTPEFENWVNPKFQPVELLRLRNDDKEIAEKIVAAKAEIYLAGPRAGQRIDDQKGSISQFIGKSSSKKRNRTELDIENESTVKWRNSEQSTLTAPAEPTMETEGSHNLIVSEALLDTSVTPRKKEKLKGMSPLGTSHRKSPVVKKVALTGPDQKNKITSFFTKKN